MEKSEAETPNKESAQSGKDHIGSQNYLLDEEAIYERAEYIFKLTDSLIFILLASMSGGIIGFFFAGAFNIAATSFISMTLGLLMGFIIWGNRKRDESRNPDADKPRP